MAKKYDERFKQKVVDDYVAGSVGYKVLARRYGISYSMVSRWVKSHSEHGKDGLQTQYGQYDPQFRLMVLTRMWEEDLSFQQAAIRFNVRRSSAIGTWARLYLEGGIEALRPGRKGRPPKTPKEAATSPIGETMQQKSEEQLQQHTHTLQDLLKENEDLRAEVAYLKKLDALLKEKARAAQKKKRA
jgi:transposase